MNLLPETDFRLINLNAQSLANKVGDIEYVLASYDPHVIIVSETWLRPEIQDCELLPPGFKIIRNDRDSRGGGVAIILQENIECVRLNGIPNHESAWCQIKLGTALVVIGAIYRSPNASIEYLEALQNYLEQQKAWNQRLIIAGDFNLPGVDWNTINIESRERADCELLLDIAFANDLTQVVQESTPKTGTVQSILDLVFLDGRFENYQVAVQDGISDHQLVFVQIKTNVPAATVKECIVHVPNFAKADDTSIIDYLSFNLDSLSSDDDVNELWARFKTIILHCVNSFVPLRKKRRNKRNPWITREIVRLKRKIGRQRKAKIVKRWLTYLHSCE